MKTAGTREIPGIHGSASTAKLFVNTSKSCSVNINAPKPTHRSFATAFQPFGPPVSPTSVKAQLGSRFKGG